MQTIQTSARQVPVVADVDVVVAGSSLAAVAAAIAAAGAGATVLLVTGRMALGEDRAAALRLWCAAGESGGPITDAAYGDDATTTPLRIKRALEDAAIAAGVELLYGSTPQALWRDADGRACGLLMVNRAGRQAVRAGAVIDATTMGIAPAPDGPWTATISRVVLGGADTAAASQPVETRAITIEDSETACHVYEQTIALSDRRPATLHAAENAFRMATYRPGEFRAGTCQWSAAPTVAVPGLHRLAVADEATGHAAGIAAAADRKETQATDTESLAGAESVLADALDLREHLGGLRPTDEPKDWLRLPSTPLPVLAQVDVLVVGGGTSGVSAAIAAARVGRRVLVLEFHDGLGGVGTLGLIGKPYAGRDVGHARDIPFPNAELTQDDKMHWLHDEIRAHGGEVWYHAVTWGAITGGAADGGATVRGVAVATPFGAGAVLATVVIDATGSADVAVAAGAGYTYGADAQDLAMQGAGLPTRPLKKAYVNSDYLLVDEHDMRDVTRALVGMRQAIDPARVFDVADFIQTRERRCVVGEHTLSYLDQVVGRTYPDTVVFSCSDYDSHGYPSLPYFALLPHTDETKGQNHPAPQGTPYTPYRCLLPRGLEGILVVGIGISMHRDASAMVRMQRDVHNMGFAAGLAADLAIADDVTPRHIDLPALQRQLVELDILPADVLTHHDSLPLPHDTVADAVAAYCDTTNTFAARSHALAIIMVEHETALPLLRAWYAEAQMARAEADAETPHEGRACYFVSCGAPNTPAGRGQCGTPVAYPPPRPSNRVSDSQSESDTHNGVQGGAPPWRGDGAEPHEVCTTAFSSPSAASREVAAVLGFLGCADGVEELVAGLDEEVWDPRILQGRMAEYAHLPTPLDARILALAYSGDARALPAILRRAATLDASVTLSHHRSVAIALSTIGDPAAAPVLAALLGKPGMSGHAIDRIVPLHDADHSLRRREGPLREIVLARALYRCGDHDGLGRRTLEAYRRDLRGLLSRHAHAVLAT